MALATCWSFAGGAHAALPSCRSVTYHGPGGLLAVQTTPAGFVQWGGELNNKADEAGAYMISVLVSGKLEDRKNKHYLYFPTAPCLRLRLLRGRHSCSRLIFSLIAASIT